MTAKRRWTNEQKAMVIRLREQGLTHKQIADQIRPGQKSAWRKVMEICTDHKKAQEEIETSLKAKPTPIGTTIDQDEIETLSNLPRSDRVPFLMARLKTSARGKAMLAALPEDKQELFTEMYLENIREFESLASAEDQMLMQALLAYCQHLHASQMHQTAERYHLLDISGDLDEDDKYGRGMAAAYSRYAQDVEKKHKEYETLMKHLKATRDQRLKSVVDQKQNFGDLQRTFVSRNVRKSVMDEIIRLERLTDDEIKRLMAGEPGPDGAAYNWLIGHFEDYE
jgi:transposase-like protein